VPQDVELVIVVYEERVALRPFRWTSATSMSTSRTKAGGRESVTGFA
jgi:hypothetical protein